MLEIHRIVARLGHLDSCTVKCVYPIQDYGALEGHEACCDCSWHSSWVADSLDNLTSSAGAAHRHGWKSVEDAHVGLRPRNSHLKYLLPNQHDGAPQKPSFLIDVLDEEGAIGSDLEFPLCRGGYCRR